MTSWWKFGNEVLDGSHLPNLGTDIRIKNGLKAIRLEGVDQICLVQVWDQLWMFVNIAMISCI
jgi:hypothetical protein